MYARREIRNKNRKLIKGGYSIYIYNAKITITK